MPLISVIMPAYNAEKYIAEAIESIINQTFTDFELLICDDGSTDNTLSIAKSFTDSRITVFQNNKNIGNLHTTNFLFSKCQGQYIAIQDADDISTKNRLELLVSEFQNDTTLGLVGSNYMITDETLNPIACGFLPITNKEINTVMQKEVPPILYAGVLVKKEIVEAIGYFRPIFNRKGYADLDWLYRICEYTNVKNTREITYLYRKHNQQFTHKFQRKLFIIHAHEIIKEAHNLRINNKADFLKTNNKFAIRKFIADIYTKKAENSFWEKNKKKALGLLIKSFVIYPFRLKTIKTFIYILRNK